MIIVKDNINKNTIKIQIKKEIDHHQKIEKEDKDQSLVIQYLQGNKKEITMIKEDKKETRTIKRNMIKEEEKEVDKKEEESIHHLPHLLLHHPLQVVPLQ